MEDDREVNYLKFVLTGMVAILIVPVLEVFGLQYKFTKWLLK